MPDEITKHKLVKFLKTSKNKSELEEQVMDLSNKISSTNPPTIQTVQEMYPLTYAVIQECYPSVSSNLERKGLLGILDDLGSLNEVMLDVPVNPTDTQSDKLCNWISEYVESSVLCDIKKSDKISGGIVISDKGVYENYSLDKIIKEKVYAQL